MQRGVGVANESGAPEPRAGRVVEHPLLGPLQPAPGVAFTFDGVVLDGREGEPIAVALLAAGYRVFRTMPRFGGPRGGYCMDGRCADCLMVVDGVPGVRACVTPIRPGLRVETQSGLGEDVRAPGSDDIAERSG